MINFLKSWFYKFFSFKSASVFLILLGIIGFFTLLTPRYSFLSSDTIALLLRITPMLGLITLGMTLLIIVGEFDLSVGSIYAFCAMSLGLLSPIVGVIPAIITSLAIGVGMGALNGTIVTKLRVNSLIATLGMMWIYRGALNVVSRGISVKYSPGEMYSEFFAGGGLGLPTQFIWMIIITVLLFLLLERTKLGNHIFCTGSNVNSARMMGIHTDRVKVICFMITGFLCAFAGIIQTSRIAVAMPTLGRTTNLQAIAAAVVGGVGFRGGFGSIPGGLLGAIIIQVLGIGIIMMGLSDFYFHITLGLMLIIGVLFNVIIEKRRIRL